VGGAKLSKTKETVISKIASEDDVNLYPMAFLPGNGKVAYGRNA
jgi:ubiquitin